MQGTFAVTDPDWLRMIAANGGGEANFWQPRPTAVRNLPGTPWIFKVRGQNAIAGFGFFSYWTEMPLAIAWETFQRANGVDSYAAMLRSVRRLRAGSGNDSDDRVGCGNCQGNWCQRLHSGFVSQAAFSRSGLLIQTSVGSSARLGAPLMKRSGFVAWAASITWWRASRNTSASPA
jgi:hypothetical protein